jgi:hypothetical protein
MSRRYMPLVGKVPYLVMKMYLFALLVPFSVFGFLLENEIE